MLQRMGINTDVLKLWLMYQKECPAVATDAPGKSNREVMA